MGRMELGEQSDTGTSRQDRDRYLSVRQTSLDLASHLEPEDMVVQSMADVSPPKWHLAHCTWFFETFLLAEHRPGYQPYNPAWHPLFNSYYQSLGSPFSRPERGLLSRPTAREIIDYRRYVDDHMVEWMAHCETGIWASLRPVWEVGLHHEQQHQELFLTDVKHILSRNPLLPIYTTSPPAHTSGIPSLEFVALDGGLREIGHGDNGFSYDNERPRHRTFLEPYALGNRLVTNGEYLEFIREGGYQNPLLWLSEGWEHVNREGWRAPLYWHTTDHGNEIFTLHGPRPLAADEPVCHISYFEADAFARWAGKRLPTEAEWEVAAGHLGDSHGAFLDPEECHPRPARRANLPMAQLLGDLWEWTMSPYTPYPGFRTPAGALGEYNGKFMCNQMVLRGGSCATPFDHIRPSYRNFFPPSARWQFSGIRLAEDR